jgi:YD repeat-containing protein
MANQALTESNSGGTLAGLAVNHAFDNYLRSSSVEIKSGSTSLQAVSYAYDNAGRLQSVTDASASSHTATYAYHAISHLINTLTCTNSGSGNGMVTTKAYDRLNRLQSIASNAFGSSAPMLSVSFMYQYDAALCCRSLWSLSGVHRPKFREHRKRYWRRRMRPACSGMSGCDEFFEQRFREHFGRVSRIDDDLLQFYASTSSTSLSRIR